MLRGVWVPQPVNRGDRAQRLIVVIMQQDTAGGPYTRLYHFHDLLRILAVHQLRSRKAMKHDVLTQPAGPFLSSHLNLDRPQLSLSILTQNVAPEAVD